MMELDTYQQLALRTEARRTDPLGEGQLRLLHATLGLVTEVGELFEALETRQHLDPVNLIEEVGDCMWYIAVLADSCGQPLDTFLGRKKVMNLPASERGLLAHAMVQVGQIVDLVKRHFFHGKGIDFTKLSMLTGALVMDLRLLVIGIGKGMDDVLDRNIAKLIKRYPDGYSDVRSDYAERDLDAEREVLEAERGALEGAAL